MTRRLLATFVLLIAIAGLARAQQSAEDLYRLGRQQFERSLYDEAIQSFRAAARASGESCAKCYFGISNAYLRIGNPAASLQNADIGIQQAKDNAERAGAHDLKGRILLLQAGDDPQQLELAEHEFREAMKLSPARVEARFNLGLALLRQYKDKDGLREIQTYLADAPKGENADWARKLLAHPTRLRATFAPDFKITTADGKTISLDQFAGKYVVLDFWATWCPPCVASMGDLRALHKKYADRLVLISISDDEDHDAWQHFLSANEHKLDWPQFFDMNHRIGSLYGINKMPTYVVIDEEGAIVQRVIGVNSKVSVFSQLKAMIDGLMGEKSSSPSE